MSIWHDDAFDPALPGAVGAATMPGFLAIEFLERGDDWLRARMPVTARVRQPAGRLHGGASVAFAETVASMAGAMTVDHATHSVVGQEINANHVRPVRDGFVYATATAEAIGRRSQVWTIRIADADGRLVCLSRMTLAVIAADRA